MIRNLAIKGRLYKNMRIGIDIRTLMDEKYSGIPEYSLRLLQEVLEIDTDNEYILFYNSFKDISDRIPEFNNSNVSIVKTNYPSKLFGYIMQKVFAQPKLDRLLDVDVFFMPHINFFAFSPRVKSIIAVHDLSFLLYPEFFSIKKNIWHKAMNVKKNLKKFDKVIAVSNNTKQDLIELCGLDEDKIELVHSGVLDSFRKIEDDNLRLNEVREKYNLPKKFFLYLGTIEPRKNVDGLILAFENLMDENPSLNDFELVIAGAKGWKYRKTINLWKQSRYFNKIKFTGYVDEGDKVYLYNLASIFVYPSFYEGFGFPPLEAMACGTPVIASANSSLTEILGEAAIFINPYNTTSIKQSMKELAQNQEYRTKLVERGYNNIEKYNWNKTANHFLKLINNLANKLGD